MSRSNRAQIAQQTLSMMQSGGYTASNGAQVSISKSLAAAKAGTLLYRPAEYEELLLQVKTRPATQNTTFSVSNCTTLAAGRELASQSNSVACLNFASAKNPGGGFLGGAEAQEESLARASGLYATLQTQLGFYEYHRAGTTCLYSDHVIYSPHVPVFRDDKSFLLSSPWECAFITSPAVNAGAVRRNEPQREHEIVPVMEARTRMVLAVAIANGCDTLVLGAWGCGVFRNDPATIADVFARILAEDTFRNRFTHIEFAVYDSSTELATLNAFQARLGTA